MVTWIELPTLVHTAACLPAVCVGLELARQRRSAAGAALAGLALGLAALAGHLQIFLFVGLVALSYGLCRLATRQHVYLLGVALALGGLIASAQLLPSLELARHSHRPGLATEAGYRGYLGRALPTYNLVTGFLPNYFGNPTRGDYWGFVPTPLWGGGMAWASNPADYLEFCLYVGVLPLLLSLYAMLFRRGSTAHYLTGLALFALLLAGGTFPNRFFYFHVPGFASSGGPCRIVLLAMFAVAVLTGLGLEQWRTDPPARRWKGGLAVAALVAVAFLASWLYTANLIRAIDRQIPLHRTPLAGDLVHFGVFFVAGLGGLWLMGKETGKLGNWEIRQLGNWATGQLGNWATGKRSGSRLPNFLISQLPNFLIYADLWLFGHAFNPTSLPAAVYPPSRLAAQLRDDAGLARVLPQLGPWSLTQPPQPVLPPNSGMALGLYDVQGYDSLYLREYKEFMNAAEGGEASPPENGNLLRLTKQSSPLLDLLGVRYVVSQTEVAAPGLRHVRGESFKVYENTRSLPRAFIVYQAEEIPDRPALLARLQSSHFDPRKTVLLEVPKVPKVPKVSEDIHTPPHPHPAQITRYEANRVVLTALLSAPGYAVLSDVAFPGWKAYVDGHPQRWQRADGLLRAVALPGGQHTVTFIYRPLAVRLGLFALGLGLLGLGGAGGWWLARRNTSASRPPPSCSGRAAEGGGSRRNPTGAGSTRPAHPLVGKPVE
jgi:hypothetical protein